ncbi:MAG: glycosyltransferase family 2 protein [Actinomycetota bacterium]|nr:glycosyltransferase family 2 protein [Actinomycetota bacterium]
MAVPEISIVVPIFNERENLPSLVDGIRAVARTLAPSELILVDDGSTDGSTQWLDQAHRADPWVKVVRLTRNFGQTAALSAGFEHARGRVIVTLDGDLQNDPVDIPRMLAKLDEGYDVVSGWRVERAERSWSRRVPSAIANRMISRLSGVRLHDYGCTLKAYRRDVVEEIELYGDAHRFLPALAASIGDRVGEIEVRHRPRAHGQSKYGLSRAPKVFLDLLALPFMLRFFNRPIRFFGGVGLIAGSLGGLVLAWLGYLRIFNHQAIGNRPVLLAGVLMVLMGVQFITLGLLGELVIRAYYATKGRRAYHVRRAFVECTPGHHVCGVEEHIRLP